MNRNLSKVCACLFSAAFLLTGKAGEFKEKSVYVSYNMSRDGNIPKIEKILEEMASLGYNTVYLNDPKRTFFRSYGEKYAANVKCVAAKCRELKLKLVVGVVPLGDCNTYLKKYPNFAEAAPVINAPYVVKNGKLVAENNLIRNGGFEDGTASWKPDSEKQVLIDRAVKCSGNNSIHIASGKQRQVRIKQTLKVQPFQQYCLSMKLKTKNAKPSHIRQCGIGMVSIGKKSGDSIYLNYQNNFKKDKIEATQDWKRYKIVFNTLECDEVDIYAGAWDLAGGEIWMDDFELKPASFVNVVRRASTPVKVISPDGKTVYEEGADFSKIIDPQLGCVKHPGIKEVMALSREAARK